MVGKSYYIISVSCVTNQDEAPLHDLIKFLAFRSVGHEIQSGEGNKKSRCYKAELTWHLKLFINRKTVL